MADRQRLRSGLHVVPAPPGAPPHRAHDAAAKLPAPLTSFFGRQEDIVAVQLLVSQQRLVTLTGAGGSGKTRLALAVAAACRDRFVDGVVFVALAPLQDPTLVEAAIATALGVRETPGQALAERLVGYLQPRALLLVLDNCEHLLPGMAVIARLLGACPAVTVLATSRTPLHLAGEQLYPVPPLPLPESAAVPLAELAANPAVALFCARVGAVRPAFKLTPDNAAAVTAICCRLDGLPLALELAAGHGNLLTPQTLLARLGHRLALLTGGPQDAPLRQRTLRATIADSYDSLAAPAQALFRRLGVFAGGFTLAAVAAICTPAAEFDTLATLMVLLDHSLVNRMEDADGEPRFALLATIREFALEQLEASGEAASAAAAHAAYFLALAEAAAPGVGVAPMSIAEQTRLVLEEDNLRAVLAWSITKDADATLGLRLAGKLRGFWTPRGQFAEGRAWLARLLARSQDAPPDLRAWSLLHAGHLATMQGDTAQASPLAEQSLALFERRADQRGTVFALLALAECRIEQDAAPEAEALLIRAVALARAVGMAGAEGIALNGLGEVLRLQGAAARAGVCYDESLAVFRRIASASGIAMAAANRAAVAIRQHDLGLALSLFREAFGHATAIGDRHFIAGALVSAARLWLVRNDPERAVQLLGAAEALREANQSHLFPADHAEQVVTSDAAHRRLSEMAFSGAWAHGRLLTPEAACMLALGDRPAGAEASPSAAWAGRRPDGLTRREAEVLGLLAQGRSAASIASALVLSVRTVDRHLANIYAKIGARGRADAATYAVYHDLLPPAGPRSSGPA